jgi:hypothetical protein
MPFFFQNCRYERWHLRARADVLLTSDERKRGASFWFCPWRFCRLCSTPCMFVSSPPLFSSFSLYVAVVVTRSRAAENPVLRPALNGSEQFFVVAIIATTATVSASHLCTTSVLWVFFLFFCAFGFFCCCLCPFVIFLCFQYVICYCSPLLLFSRFTFLSKATTSPFAKRLKATPLLDEFWMCE